MTTRSVKKNPRCSLGGPHRGEITIQRLAPECDLDTHILPREAAPAMEGFAMIVIACQHGDYKKHGQHRNGDQRYKCLDCGKTFAFPEHLLGDMRLPTEKAVLCLKMLLEGCSVRTIERLTGVARNTVCELVLYVGNQCGRFWQRFIKGVECTELQVDEVWYFVGCKVRTARDKLKSDAFGDAYVFTAIDPNTKIMVNWRVGKRTDVDTHQFMAMLSSTVVGRTQLTTDGFPPYRTAVPRYFGNRADFGTIVKIVEKAKDDRRYSPGRVTKVLRSPELGNPNNDKISTSIVERSNLTVRTRVRRFTRLTNAFSKSWAHHEAAVAMFFVCYNLVLSHGTLKTTPAVKHGLTDHAWTLEELLRALATN